MIVRAYTKTDLLLFFILSELRGGQRMQTDFSFSLLLSFYLSMQGGARLIIEILKIFFYEIMVMLCLYYAMSNFEKK